MTPQGREWRQLIDGIIALLAYFNGKSKALLNLSILVELFTLIICFYKSHDHLVGHLKLLNLCCRLYIAILFGAQVFYLLCANLLPHSCLTCNYSYE